VEIGNCGNGFIFAGDTCTNKKSMEPTNSYTIDELVVGQTYLLESTNQYLGKLIKEPEIRKMGSHNESREKCGIFRKMLNGKEILTYIPRWEDYDTNKLNMFVAYD
jgi:hypothetical protein